VRPGTRVEVRSTFDGRWLPGFEVVSLDDDGYHLRRLSDDTVLPTVFAVDDVRRERTRQTWWV
jgi:hypothetical protein